MLNFIARTWDQAIRALIIVAALGGLLYAAYSVGVYIGERNVEQKELVLKEECRSDKTELQKTITRLREQRTACDAETNQLKGEMANAEDKYEELTTKHKDTVSVYRALKERNRKAEAEIRELERALSTNRPYLNYRAELAPDNGGIVFRVYNKSATPLKILETDNVSWSDGIKGEKHPGVESMILYPERKDIQFTFSHDNMAAVKRGDIDFRGGFCAKYTTLNINDARYWMYRVWFIYDFHNSEYDVVHETDTRVRSKERCTMEIM